MCRRTGRNSCLPVVAGLGALLLLTAVAGCGGQSGGPGTMVDSDLISVGLITGLNTDPEGFPSFFVDGAVPSDSERERYARYVFKATSTDISGDSATASVRVEDLDGKLIGKEEWTAVKVGKTWKLKQAPLPDAAK